MKRRRSAAKTSLLLVLPDELLIKICELLDVFALSAVRCTCRQLRQIGSDYHTCLGVVLTYFENDFQKCMWLTWKFSTGRQLVVAALRFDRILRQTRKSICKHVGDVIAFYRTQKRNWYAKLRCLSVSIAIRLLCDRRKLCTCQYHGSLPRKRLAPEWDVVTDGEMLLGHAVSVRVGVDKRPFGPLRRGYCISGTEQNDDMTKNMLASANVVVADDVAWRCITRNAVPSASAWRADVGFEYF